MEPTWWVTGGRGRVAIAVLLACSCGGKAQPAPTDREDPDPPVKQLPAPESSSATPNDDQGEPRLKVLGGVRTVEVPYEIDGLGVMTARIEGYFNQLVEPSEATKRDLRGKGYDHIVTRIHVCTNAQGQEVLRSVDRTPYPEWDRKVLAASLEQNIEWMTRPEDRPRCWDWLAWWDLNREPSQP